MSSSADDDSDQDDLNIGGLKVHDSDAEEEVHSSDDDAPTSDDEREEGAASRDDRPAFRVHREDEGAEGDAPPADGSAPIESPARAFQPLTSDEVRDSLANRESLVALLNSDLPESQLEGAIQIRRLVTITQNPPIEAILDWQIVDRLVELLSNSSSSPSLQLETAWIITNIANGTTEQTRVLVNAGAVPVLISHLRTRDASGNYAAHAEVREQCAWALGNIAGDFAEFRDLILGLDALPSLLEMCQPSAKLSLLRTSVWVVGNLCRSKVGAGQRPPDWNIVSTVIPVLATLLCMPRVDSFVLKDICWSLSYLSDDNSPDGRRIQAIVDANVIPRLVPLLTNGDSNIVTPALRTVGNVCTGNDFQTQHVLDQPMFMPALLELLSHSKRGIRKETCWTISNITGGSTDQIQRVIDIGIVPPLIETLKNAEDDIQKEAAWAIGNITSGGTNKHIEYLVTQGALTAMCPFLEHQDGKIVMVALESLENFLRVSMESVDSNPYPDIVEGCGGLDLLEALQSHRSEDIYSKAVQILQSYFVAEEVEDEEAINAQPKGGDSAQYEPPAA